MDHYEKSLHLIHIVGRQQNGKTTLIVELVKALKQRGVRVGTLKHSSHAHELDKPGKDSYLHRQAGGTPAAIVTQNLMAVYVPLEAHQDPLAHLYPLFKDTDLVLVEGYINGPGKKIEVWRKEVGTQPLCKEKRDIVAIVTDDPIASQLKVLPRSDINQLVEFIVQLAECD